MEYYIHEDITTASTLPSAFYKDGAVFDRLKSEVFLAFWQFLDHESALKDSNCHPVTLLPNYLDEPLLLTRNKDDVIHCLSNVCTHRGNILMHESSVKRMIRCNYHGRCFNLDGTFRSMPGFEGVADFPTDKDNLIQLPLESLGPLLFTQVKPGIPFKKVFEDLTKRMYWFPKQDLILAPEFCKTYYVDAHWALYCENFLEGFHVPFVHPTLHKTLEQEAYETELYKYSSLQVGVAKQDQPHFQLPAEDRDYEKKIYAYYWWIFPNLMLNFYPWGLSLNCVEPVSLDKTRIRFLTFMLKNADKEAVLKTGIDETELEDEAIVEAVQKGITSSFYHHGRYSARHEQGVHHFHRILTKHLS